MPAIPPQWQQQVDAVEDELTRRYQHEQAWKLAEEQSGRMGDLLSRGSITGEMFVLQQD
jgi:hypothetical protein